MVILDSSQQTDRYKSVTFLHNAGGNSSHFSAITLHYEAIVEYDSTTAMKLSDQIRRAVRRSDLSQYRIAQITGIDKSQLSKFVRDVGGLSVENLDALAKLLRLRIVQDGE